MTEEQKEFAVKKIEKYNKKIQKADKDSQYFMLLGVLLLSSSFITVATNCAIAGLFTLLPSCLDFYVAFRAFKQKTGLEKELAVLQTQLDMANLENQSDDYIYDSEEKGPRI